MPLTDAAVRAATQRDKPYKLTDGEGLFLLVTTSGSKLWRLAYRFEGKQKTLAIGAYPRVKLTAARDARTAAKAKLRDGIDPSKAKRWKSDVDPASTFKGIADEWMEIQRERWVPAHFDRIEGRLAADVYPLIGTLPAKDIEPTQVLALLRKIEERGALEMAKRVRQTVGQIFRYAIATGRAVYDPSASLADALRPKPRPRHHSALKASQLPDFFAALSRYDGDAQTALGIELIAHTFVRTREAIFAEKREFENLAEPEKALWRIPAERMKARREHLVPLSPRACHLVKSLMKIAGSGDYLFPGRLGGVISNNTLLFALYRMGYHSRLTIHGLRGTASTVLNEQGFNRDWIERQLAHVPGDDVRAAYNSAEWLVERRRMMNWYSSFLLRQQRTGVLLS